METINDALPTYSVKETVLMIKSVIEDNTMLNRIRVRGEISGVYRGTLPNHTPYISFTMKQDKFQLRCAKFGELQDIDNGIADGLTVVCEGMATVYPGQSQYQLKLTSARLEGEGAEAAALNALFRKLDSEHLFEQERPLPKYPKKIALVTSPTGAAIGDFKTTILKKYPIVEVCVIPALVQGENAVPSLIAGIEQAQNVGADIIIFGRGGGSKEDMACFNSEELARAVYASRVPTISAVGHTRDRSICDWVADVHENTPTSAGNKAVPDINEVLKDIDTLRRRSAAAMRRKLSELEKGVELLAKDVQMRSPRGRIELWESNLANIRSRVANSIRQKLTNDEHELIRTAKSIANLNPLGVLSRGYAVALKDGAAVKSAEELKVGDLINVKLNKGSVTAEVKSVEE